MLATQRLVQQTRVGRQLGRHALHGTMFTNLSPCGGGPLASQQLRPLSRRALLVGRRSAARIDKQQPDFLKVPLYGAVADVEVIGDLRNIERREIAHLDHGHQAGVDFGQLA